MLSNSNTTSNDSFNLLISYPSGITQLTTTQLNNLFFYWSLVDFRESDNKSWDPVEVFCNRVAAETLMPEKIIKDELKAVNNPRDTKVSNLARKLGVSDLALATRMVSLKLIEKNVYKDFRKEHKAKMEKFLAANEKKKKKGNPDPYRLRANRNGKLFSRLVLNIYRSGQISGVDWYRLTGVKLNKLDRYQEVL